MVDTVSASLSRVLIITDGSSRGVASTTKCIYGNGLICEETGGVYSYHHYNNLGSTTKLTDADGSVVASFTYGTYGELLSGSTAFTRFLYNGRCGVTTDDNGLYYMRQRYYSSELKRFVNQDVVKGSISNSQSLNRYSYVQGNPVSYTDPFGLSPEDGKFTAPPWVHGLFGILGCIPGPVGAVANFADALVYLAEGDYMGALISCLDGFSMGATAFATKMLKAGKLCKVANTAAKAAQITERISGGLSFIQNGRNINNTVSTMYQKYAVEGRSLGWDTVGEVTGIAFSVAGCKSGLRRMGSTSNELAVLQRQAEAGQLCFVAGTKIRTADGEKNIEDIEVGDEVYSSDVETGGVGLKHVLWTKVAETTDIVHVTIGENVIDTTPNHPFYIETYGFKPASELKVGDRVRLLNGTNAEIRSAVTERLDEPVKVYNFEVEDWHTYYVTGAGVLVHNNNGCGGSKGGSGVGSISTPNSGQGFSPNGYNPQPGERTLDGYVKNHASPEISLHTDSAGFNNNNGNVGGDFKRFGAESHGGVSPHVHQPQRNVAPNGNIYGTVGTKTANGGVTSPSKKDVKQLYEYLTNGKYH